MGELDSIEAELWSFAKEKRNYPEGTPDPRIPWWHEESWTNFFKALKEPIRSTSSTAEDGKGSGEEGAAFPTAGSTAREPDALLDALEGELAADRARSRANELAARGALMKRDPLEEEKDLQEFEAELRRDLLAIQG